MTNTDAAKRMPQTRLSTSDKTRLAEKRRAAFHSILAAILLAALKLGVGVVTGSLGILSEAAHSGLDLVAAFLTYFSVQVSEKPADSDHQFGHEKVENFSAFLQTGLLLATCIWIIYEAIERLHYKPSHVEPTVWAFGVMLTAVAVDLFRSRELMATAKKYHSQSLEADAIHFSTDIWSSTVVIFGLAALWVGDHWHIPQLQKADPIAALGVAGFTIRIGMRLGRRTIDALLDAAPSGLRGRVIERVLAVDGVVSCNRVRIRNAGSKYFVDANLTVARTTPFDHVPALIEAVRERIRELLPDADIMVHSEPQAPDDDNLFEKIKWVARRSNLAIHDLVIHEVDGLLTLDLHLEVDERFTLDQAHQRVDYLEGQIYNEIPEIDVINTHIEGEYSHVQADQMEPGMREGMISALQTSAIQVPEIIDCHDIAIREVDHKIYVSCHCLMDGSLPITLVHDRTVELESLFRTLYPSIYKVTIHTEPETERGVPAAARAQTAKSSAE